jgi:uncharacterized SAM-binding protein YcdF (DUF218 family)
VIVTTAVVTATLLLSTARLFVWPPAGAVTSADAVVVLSGDPGDRMAGALELMADGVAPVLVHAGTPDSAFANALCEGGNAAYEVVCLRPQPDNTAAEARAVARLAHERGWRSLAVVTSSFHNARAGINFRRCLNGDVHMVPTASARGRQFTLTQVPREWLRVIYLQTLHRRC